MPCNSVEIPAANISSATLTLALKKLSLSSLTQSQLIEAIAWIMSDIIAAKGKNFTSESEIPEKTLFHSNTLPGITLHDYIARFYQYSKCQEDILLYAVIYLDRIGELVTNFCVDSFNVHKLLLISLAAACKFCDDKHFTNTYYANVGGVSVEDFNALEQEYLINYLQFKLYVSTDTYEAYKTDIVKYYQDKASKKGLKSNENLKPTDV